VIAMGPSYRRQVRTSTRLLVLIKVNEVPQ
jgi:hypothetical protein